jgi:hypothetical protein
MSGLELHLNSIVYEPGSGANPTIASCNKTSSLVCLKIIVLYPLKACRVQLWRCNCKFRSQRISYRSWGFILVHGTIDQRTVNKCSVLLQWCKIKHKVATSSNWRLPNQICSECRLTRCIFIGPTICICIYRAYSSFLLTSIYIFVDHNHFVYPILHFCQTHSTFLSSLFYIFAEHILIDPIL